MYSLFLLCVDRDGYEGQRAQLDHLEQQASSMLDTGKCFLAENAWQEVEVWVLAGHDMLDGRSWKEIRAEVNPKEGATDIVLGRDHPALREWRSETNLSILFAAGVLG